MSGNFEKKVIKVEEDLRVFFMPHTGQKKVLFAVLFQLLAFVFVQCGRKFGKTDLALYCCYWFAMVFDGCEVYYTADTQKHARELVWSNQRLQNFLKKVKRKKNESANDFMMRKKQAEKIHDKWIDRINSSEMKVYLSNGSFIGVEGAENYANADGLEPQFIVYDEFKHHDPRFNEAMEPNMDVYNGTILSIGTPPANTENYYCKIAADCRRRNDAAFFKMPSYLNEYVYPGGEEGQKFQKVIDKYIGREEWDVLQREYYANIIPGGSNSIFPQFRPLILDDFGNVQEHSVHVRPHEELVADIKRYPKDWDLYVSMDPGSAHCFAVLFGAVHKKSNAVIIFDEIYETDQMETSAMEIFPRVLRKMDEIEPNHENWTMFYDHAALWLATEVAVNFDYGLIPCTKDMKNKEIKLGMIKDCMNAGLFFMSDRCTGLSNEMVNYIKDKNGKIPLINDHAVDALRYLYNGACYDFTLMPQEADVDPEERRRYTIDNDPIMSGGDDDWDRIIGDFYE